MLKGEILNNRYKVNEIIGVGGMAYVYDGYDTLLERNVAIKILKDDYAQTQDFLDKFKLEATSAASLNDENIVGIFDVGSEKIEEKTIEYIVMEKINGTTLKSVIEEKGPLSNEDIIYYARQIAMALQAAHRKGVVHRDIKPANILINEHGKVKVTDFGIARVSSQATLTYTSSILGTVHYISPEQAKGQPIDNRSDLYSLGVVLYEMATGDVPFDAETPVTIAIKHLQEEARPIREVNSKIDKKLASIICKLLSKDVSTRYQSAAELINNLDNYKNVKILNVDKSTKRVDKPDAIASKVEYKSRNTIAEKTEPERKSNFKLVWLLIPLAVVVGIIILSSLLNQYADKNKAEDKVSVPNVFNFEESNAISRLIEANLSPVVDKRVYDDKVPEGYVLSQSIQAKEYVEKGSEIKLTISYGPKMVQVPRLIGYDYEEVQEELKNLGLDIGTVRKEHSDRIKNSVIEQSPDPYSKPVPEGTKIDLVISLGREVKKTTVPNLRGQDQATAINTLRVRDLIPGSIDQDYSDEPINTVISQAIESGTKVNTGIAIDFVISKGPKKVEPEKPPVEEPPVQPEKPPVEEPPKPPEKPPVEEPPVVNPDVEEKNFVFNVTAPSQGGKFNVKIYTIEPKKELVYEGDFVTEKLKDGIAVIKIKARSDAKFEILLNDKVANVQYE